MAASSYLTLVDGARAHNGFVAMDPEGYDLEWDTFLPVVENRRLPAYLAGG